MCWEKHVIEISYSSHFLRQVKKLSAVDQKKLSQKIEMFKKNPSDIRLRTHVLSGRLKKYFAFSLDHSQRVIFMKPKQFTILFIDVGTHDEVYL